MTTNIRRTRSKGQPCRTGPANKLVSMFLARYAWMIIDTPPILAAADTTMLARHANVLWLVARSGQSRMGDLKEACKRLKACGLAPTGVILNGLVQRLGRYGASYCTYGGYRDVKGR